METRDLAARRSIEELEHKIKCIKRENIDKYTTEAGRLVNHQIIHLLSEDCRIYRHEWQQLARTALTLANINAIRLLVVHLTTHGDEGLQWLDSEFCAAVYNQAKTLGHPEIESLFDDLAALAEKAEHVGLAWLMRHNINSMIDRQDNYFVDDYPDLFFRQPLFNLMADVLHGSRHSTASNYFANDRIRDQVYPQLQKHRLLPRRRQAIDAIYQKMHYLDAYEPAISDIKFTEPKFVAQLTKNELTSMKQMQESREYAGHVRLERIVPKPYQITTYHAKMIGMMEGDEPPLDDIEQLLGSYTVLWERRINDYLIKQENTSERGLMSGAITGIYESLEEMHLLLLLRMLKTHGDYIEFAKLIINDFINNALNESDKIKLTNILPWRSAETMMENIIKRHVDTKLDVGVVWSPQYTQRFMPTLCSHINIVIGNCFVHKTMPHAQAWMQSGVIDHEDWVSGDLVRIKDVNQAVQEQHSFRMGWLKNTSTETRCKELAKCTMLHYIFDRIEANYKVVPTTQMPMVTPPERCLIADEVHLKTPLRTLPIHRLNPIDQLHDMNTTYHLGLTDFYRSCPKSIMRPFVDALDVYNRTAYVTNPPVMDVIRRIFENGGDVTVGIPNHNLSKAHFIKPEKGLSPGDFREKLINEEVGLVEETNNALCALYDLGDRPYWLPNTIDYRGRLYPNASIVSHLNSDKIRACHKFADKKKLGKSLNGQFSGFEWLVIHAMNVAEVLSKPTREEALVVGKKLIPIMIESATDPINGSGWWRMTERPFQTLAACFEIKAAIDSGNVDEFESNLPVYQDGTCNGYQHWSAIGRDKTGALASNVLGDQV